VLTGRTLARRVPPATLAALLALTLTGCSSPPSNATPPSAKVLVAIALKTDGAGLATYADDAAERSPTSYHRFLTMPEIAARYGAPRSVITKDLRALAGEGIHLSVDPTHGALWGLVTAAQAKSAFGTTLVTNDGVIAPDSSPHVPSGLNGATSVVGLTGTTAGSSSTPRPTSSTTCPTNPISAPNVAATFGFEQLLSKGLDGNGIRLEILARHNFIPAVFTTYNTCTKSTLSDSRISESSTPGTPPGIGGPEVALDTLALTMLAPKASLHVERFDPSTQIAFPLMAIAATPPNVLDITVTYCESQLNGSSIALSEWMLSALAAAGTSTVAATGDTGSSACYPNSSGAAVSYPASSAFVTAIGGANYGGSIGEAQNSSGPTNLSVWNEPGAAGGGGGTSARIAAPPWQPAGKRRLPDASSFALPGPLGAVPVCTTSKSCQWQFEGGTSLSATALSAAAALLAQDTAEKGRGRWGNLAVALWHAGANDPAITDITRGANTTFNSSCCQATTGYDTASGWGLFDPDALLPVLESP
jgi:subtilase family serine protease